MADEVEKQIKLYKLFGVVFGKKDSTSSGSIPVFASGENNTLEDSGVTKEDLGGLVNATPAGAIADLSGSATLPDVINKVNEILVALRSKDIISP